MLHLSEKLIKNKEKKTAKLKWEIKNGKQILEVSRYEAHFRNPDFSQQWIFLNQYVVIIPRSLRISYISKPFLHPLRLITSNNVKKLEKLCIQLVGHMAAFF